jgi:2,3-dihydroxy-2,3-dihydrophenylpropionate dehydrogenase
LLSEAFDHLFNTNVKSNLLAVKAALSRLVENNGDVILTIPGAAFYPGSGGPIHAASSFAVRGLVTQLAYELAPEIRVNGVAPGGTLAGVGAPGLLPSVQRPADLSSIGSAIDVFSPRRAIVEPGDHSWTYAFLASRDRTPMVNGAIINSDGGVGIHRKDRMAGFEP